MVPSHKAHFAMQCVIPYALVWWRQQNSCLFHCISSISDANTRIFHLFQQIFSSLTTAMFEAEWSLSAQYACLCCCYQCCCAGKPRRTNEKFVHRQISNNEQVQLIDAKIFRSGTFGGKGASHHFRCLQIYWFVDHW